MTYVLPANRSNGAIKRFNFELYVMPKQDKTGLLTMATEKANAVLATKTYQYQVGLRVRAIDRRNAKHVTGFIRSVNWNMGLIEYTVQDDAGNRYYVVERDIRQVLSLAVKPIQAITAITSTQHTQTYQKAS